MATATSREEERLRKTILAALFLLILIAAGTYAYLTIYLPQKRLLEQRIAPLVDAFIEEGYPKQIAREKALAFDSSHLNWTANNQYNQSVIEYAVLLDRFPQLLVVEDGGMDENEWGLVDYLTSLKHQQLIPSDIMNLVPQNYTREVFSSLGNRTLSYVLSDGVVSGAEANALSYLQNFEAYPTQRRLIEFGLENSTIAWIDLLSSLDNQTFASYALRSRLCIGDKELTPLEIKFLKNPENHSLQLIEEYLTKLDEKYPQLVSELKKLPEHQSSNKVKVVEALEDVVTLALQGEPYENPEDRFDPQKITRAREVWEAFDLMLKGGTPDQRDFTYPVPSHNTELQCLYWLAEQNEFKEKDTLAQAIAMTHGLFVTMGTEEVRKAVYKDINEFLEFGRSTSELQKALGLPYNLENYPLEAKVCWAWRGNEIMKWNPLKWQPTMPTSLVYYSSKPLPLVIYEKDTVSITALRKMREFIKDRFLSKNVNTMVTNIEKYFWIDGYGLWEFTTLPKLVTDEDGLDAYRDVDWQFNRYLQGIKMKGDCSTEMAIVDAFSKSIGISTIPHWTIRKQLPLHRHAFNWYYDPISGKWKAARIHFTIPQFENEAIYDWHIYLPPINQKGYLYNRLEENNGIETYYGNYLYTFREVKVKIMKEKLVSGVPQNEMKTYILYSR